MAVDTRGTSPEWDRNNDQAAPAVSDAANAAEVVEHEEARDKPDPSTVAQVEVPR